MTTISHQKAALNLLLILMLSCSFYGCKKNISTLSFSTSKQEVPSAEYPKIKVALIDFMPLPNVNRFKYPVNKKVMTREFYCAEKDPVYKKGYFIPKEYRRIIRENIQFSAQLQDIDLTVHNSLTGIVKGRYGLVITGRIINAKVSDLALIEIELLVLDGTTFQLLHRTKISHTESRRQSDPIHTPIHFIGEHEKDFNEQRTLLSYTAHMLAYKIFEKSFEDYK